MTRRKAAAEATEPVPAPEPPEVPVADEATPETEADEKDADDVAPEGADAEPDEEPDAEPDADEEPEPAEVVLTPFAYVRAKGDEIVQLVKGDIVEADRYHEDSLEHLRSIGFIGSQD